MYFLSIVTSLILVSILAILAILFMNLPKQAKYKKIITLIVYNFLVILLLTLFITRLYGG